MQTRHLQRNLRGSYMKTFQYKKMFLKGAKRALTTGVGTITVTGLSQPPDKAAMMSAAVTIITFTIHCGLNWLKNHKF